MGEPVKIRIPTSFQTVKMAYKLDAEDDEGYGKNLLNIGKDGRANIEEMVQEAKNQSEKMLKAAESRAKGIIEVAMNEAKEKAIAIEEEARQIGFEKGYEQGYEEAKKMYEELVAEAELIKERAIDEYNKAMSQIEADALELIMDVSRKVIGEQITLNKEYLIHLVGEALGKSSNRENIMLKVSNQDYDFVMDNKEKILSMVEGVGTLDIKRDPALNPGDCLVETPYGSIDAGVETKLRKIEEAFMKMVSPSRN